MVCIIYRYKNLQEKNENMMRIITLQFRLVFLLVRREGREKQRGGSWGTLIISVLDGFLKINLD